MPRTDDRDDAKVNIQGFEALAAARAKWVETIGKYIGDVADAEVKVAQADRERAGTDFVRQIARQQRALESRLAGARLRAARDQDLLLSKAHALARLLLPGLLGKPGLDLAWAGFRFFAQRWPGLASQIGFDPQPWMRGHRAPVYGSVEHTALTKFSEAIAGEATKETAQIDAELKDLEERADKLTLSELEKIVK